MTDTQIYIGAGAWLLALLDADLIRTALRHADISITKAALWMEMDKAQLERQLAGEGHLRHTALLKLPLAFHKWFALLQVERYGVPAEVKRAALAQLAVLGRKRMAKVAAPEASAERQVS